jgi:hypothetical protein
MPLSNSRMVEIRRQVAGHAEPLINLPRTPVRRHREGSDLGKPELEEAVLDRN